jgi:hypothetical protein
MDDQTTDRMRFISIMRRILKWLTIVAWGLTLYMLVSTALAHKYGDSLDYGITAASTVILAQLALFPTSAYVLAVVVEKLYFPRKQK